MNRVILHLTGMHSTKLGGLEKYFLEVVAQCAKKGYRTVIQYESQPASRDYIGLVREAGGEVVVQPTPSTVWGASERIYDLISSARPEVINTHFYPRALLPLVSIISRLAGVRSRISIVHSEVTSKSRLKIRVAYSGFDHVLGVSDCLTKSLQLYGLPQRKLRTHYLGLIDPAKRSEKERAHIRRSLQIPESAVVFATVAFDLPVKGLDLLFDAFAKVLAADPSAHLIQLGVDPARSALAKRYSGIMNVHWLGIKDNASSYLQAVDVYVQPSRSEGLPLAIMEAMAMEIPVVATRVGGIPEAVLHERTGVLVEPNNAKALADGLLEVGYALAADQRSILGKAGYLRFRELFDGRRSVESLVALYEGGDSDKMSGNMW